MARFHGVFFVGACIVVAGCDEVSVDIVGGGREPAARLVTLSDTGVIPDQNFTGTGVSGSDGIIRIRDGDTSGFRYAYGSVANTNEFLGVAGFVPDPDVGDLITTGFVTYDAAYRLTLIEATTLSHDGDIDLIANFGTGRVTGADDGLVVNGTFAGDELDGSVSFGGVTAELDGAIGQDGIVGAFAGTGRNSVLVGGFLGDAD